MQLKLKNNETFVAHDEISRDDSCSGCAFEYSDSCVMSDGSDMRCSAHNIIWMRVKSSQPVVEEKPSAPIKPTEGPKYTVEQVLHSYGECTASVDIVTRWVDRVQDRLKQLEESDYKTYLLLKARFEG